MPNELTTRRLTVASIWVTVVALSTYAFFFEPGKTGFFPSCVFRSLTGLSCPGCGSTRALHQLLHGHVATAFTLNPLLLVALPIMLFVLLRHTRWAMSGATPEGNRLPASIIYALFFVLLSFWIIRNTSIYPFVS